MRFPGKPSIRLSYSLPGGNKYSNGISSVRFGRDSAGHESARGFSKESGVEGAPSVPFEGQLLKLLFPKVCNPRLPDSSPRASEHGCELGTGVTGPARPPGFDRDPWPGPNPKLAQLLTGLSPGLRAPPRAPPAGHAVCPHSQPLHPSPLGGVGRGRESSERDGYRSSGATGAA